jgi:hypothetical protein
MSNIDGVDEWLRSECLDFLQGRQGLLDLLSTEELKVLCRRVKGLSIRQKCALK